MYISAHKWHGCSNRILPHAHYVCCDTHPVTTYRTHTPSPLTTWHMHTPWSGMLATRLYCICGGYVAYQAVTAKCPSWPLDVQLCVGRRACDVPLPPLEEQITREWRAWESAWMASCLSRLPAYMGMNGGSTWQ